MGATVRREGQNSFASMVPTGTSQASVCVNPMVVPSGIEKKRRLYAPSLQSGEFKS